MGFSLNLSRHWKQPMPEEATVKIDERGRVTIPQGTRVALGINNTETWVRLRVETVDKEVDTE